MKITAKTRTQVSGYGIVLPYETIDLDESRIDKRIMANFTRADGQDWEEVGGASSSLKEEGNTHSPTPTQNSDSKKQLIERTSDQMGRPAIIAALEQAKISFSTNETTKSLAKKYLRSIGQEVD